MIKTLIFTMIFAACAAAQPVKTPTPKPALKSVKTQPGAARFTSVEGKYSIALPKDVADFQPITPTADSPKETGGKHTWALREAVISVTYTDDPDFVVKTEKDYADLAEGMRAGVESVGGTLTSEKAFKLGAYRGYQVTFLDPDKMKAVSRMLIVNGRKYSMFGLVIQGHPTGLALVTKAMDSFKLTP